MPPAAVALAGCAASRACSCAPRSLSGHRRRAPAEDRPVGGPGEGRPAARRFLQRQRRQLADRPDRVCRAGVARGRRACGRSGHNACRGVPGQPGARRVAGRLRNLAEDHGAPERGPRSSPGRNLGGRSVPDRGAAGIGRVVLRQVGQHGQLELAVRHSRTSRSRYGGGQDTRRGLAGGAQLLQRGSKRRRRLGLPGPFGQFLRQHDGRRRGQPVRLRPVAPRQPGAVRRLRGRETRPGRPAMAGPELLRHP